MSGGILLVHYGVFNLLDLFGLSTPYAESVQQLSRPLLIDRDHILLWWFLLGGLPVGIQLIPMRLTSSLVISAVTLLVGLWARAPFVWLPVTVLLASVIELFTRSWVTSDRLGRAVTLSVLLKFSFALIGFYAMVGQVICVGLLGFWITSAF